MTLTKQTFDNIKDKYFDVAFNADTVSQCQLIEVKGIQCSTLEHGQSEPFSLIFETPGDLVFEQNTYAIQNTELDEFHLFLVPVGADENGVRYEAVFT